MHGGNLRRVGKDGDRAHRPVEPRGPFENVFVWLLETDGGGIRRLDVWDVAEADTALGRFEELRSGS
jgi:hypothetical protein